MSLMAVFILFALFGSTFTFTKMALAESTVCFLLAFRMTIAGILLMFYCSKIKKEKIWINSRIFLWTLLLGLLSFFLCNLLEFWGLRFLTSSKACFIYSLTPFLTALFSYFLFKEKITQQKMLGLVIGICAFIPTFMSSPESEQASKSISFFSFAELALVGATTCAVLGWLVIKKLGQENQISIPMLNGQAMLFTGILSFICSFIVDDYSHSSLIVNNWSNFLIYTGLMIIISNFICYNLYGYLLKIYSATFMSLAGFLTPLFAALWGWIFLTETLEKNFTFSMTLVAFAMAIFYSQEIKEEKGIFSQASRAAKSLRKVNPAQ